jgi:uncharacterized membrane protein YeaQ/YmgE (transglycosylase-associated protein family)
MSLIPLIISLLSGAVGGNLAGTMFKNINLGTLGNSIAGILGGGLGGWLLGLLGIATPAAGATVDLVSILGSVASGGVGGGVLMAIVGFVKQSLAKK